MRATLSLLLVLAACTGNEGPASVVELRQSSGFCSGWCTTVANPLPDGQIDGELLNEQDSMFWENDIALSAAGRDALAKAEDVLRGELQDATYGCPGCVDDPVYTVEIENDAGTVLLTWQPGFDDLPRGVALLDPVATAVLNGIAFCEEDPLVELPEDCAGTPR